MTAPPSPEEREAIEGFAAGIGATVVVTDVRAALDHSLDLDYVVYQPVYDEAGREVARHPVRIWYLDQDTDIHLVQEDLVLVQFGVSPRRITDGEPSREFGLNVVLVAVRRIEHQGWGDCDLYVVVGIIF